MRPRREQAFVIGQWLAILLFVPMAWGYNWVVMKKTLAYSGPFEFSALRFVLASGCLFAALAALKRPLKVQPISAAIWVGLLQTAGNFGFSMWALMTGPAGRSAVLCYTMPFWVILMAWPMLGERPSRVQWLGAGVACSGLVLIFASTDASGNTPNPALPNGMLAPLWDDLLVIRPAGIYTALQGDVGDRQFIIEWRNVTFFGAQGVATFEIILNEADNSIVYQYNRADVSGDGRGATLGIENQSGTIGTQYSCNEAIVTVGTAVRYFLAQ